MEGDHKHKIMDRTFMPKYGTVSQVLLQLVVANIAIYHLFDRMSVSFGVAIICLRKPF